MADITKGAVILALCTFGLLAATVFSPRPEPAGRLVEIIKAVRGHTSDG